MVSQWLYMVWSILGKSAVLWCKMDTWQMDKFPFWLELDRWILEQASLIIWYNSSQMK